MPLQKPEVDHDLVRVARKAGVITQALREHAQNRDLLTARDHGVLFSEDEVFVPDPEPKRVAVAVGDSVVLVYRPARRVLHLQLHDDAGRPRQCDYTLHSFEYDGTQREDLPDKLHGFAYQGVLREPLPAGVMRLKLVLDDDEDNALTLELGRLDPVSTTRGLKIRLMNLGLYQSEVETSAIDNAPSLDPHLREAIIRFQRQYDLPATGVADPETRDKLRRVCGG